MCLSSGRREDDMMAEVADRGQRLNTLSRNADLSSRGAGSPEMKNSWVVCFQNFLEPPQQEKAASVENLAFLRGKVIKRPDGAETFQVPVCKSSGVR